MRVVARLIENGYKVLMPIGEDNRYGLVAERENRFIRIQVKYVTPKNGAMEVNCRSSNNWSVLCYSEKEIDVIAAYNGKTGDIYYIPVSEINKSTFKLRIEQSKNKQKMNVHIASDFESLERCL